MNKTKKKAGTKQNRGRVTQSPVKRGETTASKKKNAKSAEKKKTESVLKQIGIESVKDVREISLTKNKISVTRERSVKSTGQYSKQVSREYYPITQETIKAMNEAANDSNVKKITVQMKK